MVNSTGDVALLAFCLLLHACPLSALLVERADEPTSPQAAQWISRATAIRNEGVAAQARGQAAFAAVQRILVDTQTERSDLERFLTAAQQQASEATSASNEAVAGLTVMQNQGPGIVAAARSNAVGAVEDLLVKRNRQLQVWRDTVLTDRFKKGRETLERAQKPYYEAIDVEYGRMYKEAADAAAARSGANKQEQRASEEPDLKLATSFRMQSQDLQEQADEAQSRAEEHYDQIAEYLVQAHNAGMRAEATENPGQSPPLPVDPSFAYAPPAGPAAI
mmetsp:Transcript_28643/g.66024  ORF Transcript_28643/g.66024 Transcript_28643/m.66024 type:complete len:277 (-) Transcript_28643:57-887(-)